MKARPIKKTMQNIVIENRKTHQNSLTTMISVSKYEKQLGF